MHPCKMTNYLQGFLTTVPFNKYQVYKISANIRVVLPSLPSLPAASPRWPGSPHCRLGRARCPAWPPPLPGHCCQSVWSCAQTPAPQHLTITIHQHHKEIRPLLSNKVILSCPVRSEELLVKVRDTQVTFKWREIAKMLRNLVTTSNQHQPQSQWSSAPSDYCWTNVVITPSSALSWGSLLSKRGRN